MAIAKGAKRGDGPALLLESKKAGGGITSPSG